MLRRASTPDLPNEAEALREENERLRRSVEELSVLNDLAAEIGGARDAEAVMQRVLQRSIRAVGAEQGVVSLVDAQETDTAQTFLREVATSAGREALHLEQHLLGWMAHHRQPLVLNDPRADPRFRGVAWRPDVQSLICVPLLIRGRLTGVLTLFNKKDGAGFNTDDERLLTILAAQSAQVIENARLAEEEASFVRVQEEMRLAATIQADLLPSTPPDVPGYDIAGLSLPSEAVGGDYFDFLALDNGLWGLTVGDVVGKGLGAALLMANVQATLRGQTLGTTSPAACLERANALLHASTSRRAFVTLFYGVLDPERHALCYANAGHNRPFLLAGGAAPVELGTGGLALGLIAGATYDEAEVVFAPGDGLVIYSDGVTEAMSPTREPFGEEQLVEVLGGCRDESAGDIAACVVEAVSAYAGIAPQSDDLTLLVVRRVE